MKKKLITALLTLTLGITFTAPSFADTLPGADTILTDPIVDETITPSPEKPAKVENLRVYKREYKSFMILWDKVEGATSYEVYRSTTGKTGSFLLKRTTSGTYYINSDIKMNKRYYYKVRAVNDAGRGVFSEVKDNYSLPAMTENLKAAARDKNAITLTWNKSSAALKYEVYRSTDGKNFTLKKTTTGTTYTNTALTTLKRYYYKVRPVFTGGNGRFSGVVSARPHTILDKTEVEAPMLPLTNGQIYSASETGKTYPVTLTWSTVANANGYEIVKRALGKTKWTGLDGKSDVTLVEANTVTDNVKYFVGSGFEYKVRPVSWESNKNDRYAGEYSAAVKVNVAWEPYEYTTKTEEYVVWEKRYIANQEGIFNYYDMNMNLVAVDVAEAPIPVEMEDGVIFFEDTGYRLVSTGEVVNGDELTARFGRTYSDMEDLTELALQSNDLLWDYIGSREDIGGFHTEYRPIKKYNETKEVSTYRCVITNK